MAHKMTEDRVDRLVEAILKGANYTIAAAVAGIGRRTLYRWIKAGEAQESPEAVAFVARVRAAEAETGLKCLESILDAAKSDWRAARWWLERRFPDGFGPQAVTVNVHSQDWEEEALRYSAERVAKMDEETYRLIVEPDYWGEDEPTEEAGDD